MRGAGPKGDNLLRLTEYGLLGGVLENLARILSNQYKGQTQAEATGRGRCGPL